MRSSSSGPFGPGNLARLNGTRGSHGVLPEPGGESDLRREHCARLLSGHVFVSRRVQARVDRHRPGRRRDLRPHRHGANEQSGLRLRAQTGRAGLGVAVAGVIRPVVSRVPDVHRYDRGHDSDRRDDTGPVLSRALRRLGHLSAPDCRQLRHFGCVTLDDGAEL